jgi:hypothetical protein
LGVGVAGARLFERLDRRLGHMLAHRRDGPGGGGAHLGEAVGRENAHQGGHRWRVVAAPQGRDRHRPGGRLLVIGGHPQQRLHGSRVLAARREKTDALALGDVGGLGDLGLGQRHGIGGVFEQALGAGVVDVVRRELEAPAADAGARAGRPVLEHLADDVWRRDELLFGG